MFRNTFFNPADKIRSKRNLLKDFCENDIIPKQKYLEQLYKKSPDDYLIRDKFGNYKIVTKHYYFYDIQEDEYDTDNELIDEEDEEEENRIKNKYNKTDLK